MTDECIKQLQLANRRLEIIERLLSRMERHLEEAVKQNNRQIALLDMIRVNTGPAEWPSDDTPQAPKFPDAHDPQIGVPNRDL